MAKERPEYVIEVGERTQRRKRGRKPIEYPEIIAFVEEKIAEGKRISVAIYNAIDKFSDKYRGLNYEQLRKIRLKTRRNIRS